MGKGCVFMAGGVKSVGVGEFALGKLPIGLLVDIWRDIYSETLFFWLKVRAVHSWLVGFCTA